MDQSCGNCEYLDLPLNKNGRRYKSKGGAYRCLVPLPEFPALPRCVTGAFRFSPITMRDRRAVQPDEGQTCPCYKRREDGDKQ